MTSPVHVRGEGQACEKPALPVAEPMQGTPAAMRNFSELRDEITVGATTIRQLHVGNVAIHGSHRLRITRGLAWCMKCGGIGSVAGQTRAHGVKLGKSNVCRRRAVG